MSPSIVFVIELYNSWSNIIVFIFYLLHVGCFHYDQRQQHFLFPPWLIALIFIFKFSHFVCFLLAVFVHEEIFLLYYIFQIEIYNRYSVQVYAKHLILSV